MTSTIGLCTQAVRGILDTVAQAVGVERTMFSASDEVLATHGNCSSATVLVVLEELCRRGVPGAGSTGCGVGVRSRDS